MWPRVDTPEEVLTARKDEHGANDSPPRGGPGYPTNESAEPEAKTATPGETGPRATPAVANLSFETATAGRDQHGTQISQPPRGVSWIPNQ